MTRVMMGDMPRVLTTEGKKFLNPLAERCKF